MKKILFLFTFLILITLAGYLYVQTQWTPYGSGGILWIPKGHGVSQIALELKKQDLIRNTWSFKLYNRLKGTGVKLQAGEYEFPAGISTAGIVDKLIRGEQIRRNFTIPEGYNFKQIAKVIAETGVATEAQVHQTFRDPRFLNLLGFNATSLEGYLFPATYEYNRGTTLQALITQMIQSFKNQFSPEMLAKVQEMGWNLPQVVTLASIIEKETGRASERPLIGSVFHNRLKKGMLLQSDPTIIYGLKGYDGNIRKKDILDPHPYNTYVHSGLPPGPIASPGLESLRAVLFPAESEYLYFVAKGDGTHQFSMSLEEHNSAVRKFQLGQ